MPDDTSPASDILPTPQRELAMTLLIACLLLYGFQAPAWAYAAAAAIWAVRIFVYVGLPTIRHS